MRNKIYTSLFLGMGLVLGATASHAKTNPSNSKKHATHVETANRSKPVTNKVHSGLASKQKSDSHKEHLTLNSSHSKKNHEQAAVSHTKSHQQASAHRKNSSSLASNKHKRSHTLASRHHKAFHQRLASKRRGSHYDKSQSLYAKRREEDLIVEETAVSEDETTPENQNVAGNPLDTTDSWGGHLSSDLEKKSLIEEQPHADNLAETEKAEPHTQHWGHQLTSAVINNKRVHSIIDNGQAFINNGQHTNIMSASSGDTANHTVKNVHAVITTSLADAGEQAGLSEDLIMQITEIFAWDIDFATNLRPGDSFSVMYEQGNANNPIIAAQFINDGRVVTAFRYKDSEGMVNYYAPDGKSMRKAFLSSPLEFLHVSSHFSTHRKHPILNRIRAHKGVDYAARTGTPVKAAGNGEVAFVGSKGGYGQTLIIKHGEHYETVYAHLSNFKKGLAAGDTVKQGEVVAFVGQTGMATGPHLHYEFRIDGVHQNPEKLNTGHTLAENNDIWNDFHAKTLPLLVQINKIKSGTLFAELKVASIN